MFWKTKNDPSKNTVNSVEYESLVKRILELDTNIRLLKADVQILQTDAANLRGKFNSKLKGIKENEAQEEKIERENFNSDGYVAFG